jgi:hypothetical protein
MMKHSPPVISVLTSVYNGERYLAECIGECARSERYTQRRVHGISIALPAEQVCKFLSADDRMYPECLARIFCGAGTRRLESRR